MVLIYTGNGKGKTSAAMGAALRALGHGHRVHVSFFMKGMSQPIEQATLSGLKNITFSRFGPGRYADPDNITVEDKAGAQQSLSAAREAIFSGNCELVILDEINIAAAWKLIEIDDIIELIESKPAGVDLILTGRYANEKLMDHADLVTEMREIKHPFSSGRPAKKGIDY